MKRMELEAAIMATAKLEDGRRKLSCARAHVLAEDLGLPLAVVGEYCQANDIKIVGCLLGCFGSGKSCG